MALVDLPNEILLLIGKFAGLRQFTSLNRVNQQFYDLFTPHLYKHNALQGDPVSIMLWAAERGLLSPMKFAFKYGADLNYTGASNEAVIWKTAGGGMWLYDRRESNGLWLEKMCAAPLHLAALYNHEHVVKWLLENGARLNVPSYKLCCCKLPQRFPYYQDGHNVPRYMTVPPWYPLHYAISHGVKGSVLSLLVKHGATYATKDVPGIAVALEDMIKPAIDIILNQGHFDPNWRDRHGNTALHLLYERAVLWRHWAPGQRCEKTLAFIKGLVDRGVPIDAKAEGKRLFSTMLDKRNLLCVIEALKAGADASDDLHATANELGVIDQMFEPVYMKRINGKKLDGNGQLTKPNQQKLLKIAIERGADVNRGVAVNKRFLIRPLYGVLLFSRDFKCVKMMLDAGARIKDAFLDSQSGGAEGLLCAFFDRQEGYLRYRCDANRLMDETDLEPFKGSLKLLLKRGARIDGPSQQHHSALKEVCGRVAFVGCENQRLLVNIEAYRYQYQRLEECYDRAAPGKKTPFWELEFLVEHATIRNVSVEYVEGLLGHKTGEEKVQNLLKQLHTKLLNSIDEDGDEDEDEDDEIEDEEEEDENDPSFCPVCNPPEPCYKLPTIPYTGPLTRLSDIL